MPHHDITGFVLAGGKSSRMGVNKALLSLDGHTLVERTRQTLEQACASVRILGPREVYGDLGECVEDIYRDCGPLGGIHAALTNAATAHSLLLAVDTPFIAADFLAFMIERALESGAMVTAPRIGGVVQPLCAVFSREFLPLAEAALKAGKYKVEPVFPRDRTLHITEEDLSKFALGAQMFENLNTPEDFERAQKRLGLRP